MRLFFVAIGFAAGYIVNGLMGNPMQEEGDANLSVYRKIALAELDHIQENGKESPALMSNLRNNARVSTSAAELRDDAKTLRSKGYKDAAYAFDQIAADVEAVV